MRVLLFLLCVVPGLVGAYVFGSAALRDWGLLMPAYQRLQGAIEGQADVRELIASEAVQNLHRINLFADGTWTLLSAILAAIGLHGLATAQGRSGPTPRPPP